MAGGQNGADGLGSLFAAAGFAPLEPAIPQSQAAVASAPNHQLLQMAAAGGSAFSAAETQHLQLMLQAHSQLQQQQQLQQRLQQQQTAAFLQQASGGASAGAANGSDLLQIAQALAASGLLGPSQPSIGSDAASLGSLSSVALPGLGQLQGLAGVAGFGSGLNPFAPMGMHSSSLGPPPPTTAPFQLSQSLLPGMPPPLQQQQQPQPQAGPGGSSAAVSTWGLREPQLLQQLYQLTELGKPQAQQPHMHPLNSLPLGFAGTAGTAGSAAAAPPTVSAAMAAAPSAAASRQQLQQQPPPLPQQQPPPLPQQQQQAEAQASVQLDALAHSQQQLNSGEAAAGQPRPQRRKAAATGKRAASAAKSKAAAAAAAGTSGVDAGLTARASAPPSVQARAGGGSVDGSLSEEDGTVVEVTGDGAGKQQPEDRLAAARQKNREAQQRFRERQRAAAREAEVQYNQMLEQLTQLRLENKQLAQWSRTMMAVLAVRDSMLLAFNLGKTSGTASTSNGAAAAAAAAAAGPGTAAVAAVAPAAQQQQQQQAESVHAPLERASVPGGAGAAAPAAAAAAVGGSSQQGVSGSTEIEDVEPGSHGMLREPFALREARELTAPEEYIAYYQQAQVEMRFALELCRDNNNGEEERRAVEASHQLMQDIWAHVLRISPQTIKVFLRDLSPPDGTESERWELIASQVELPESDADLQVLHRGYRRLLKQSARISQERQQLQAQLARVLELHDRAVAAPGPWSLRQLDMRSQAGLLLEVLEMVQGMNHLADEEFFAIKAFCAPMCAMLGQYNMAIINAGGAPFVPNFLDISRRVLLRAAEQGRLVGSNGARLTLGEVDQLTAEEDQDGEELQLARQVLGWQVVSGAGTHQGRPEEVPAAANAAAAAAQPPAVGAEAGADCAAARDDGNNAEAAGGVPGNDAAAASSKAPAAGVVTAAAPEAAAAAAAACPAAVIGPGVPGSGEGSAASCGGAAAAAPLRAAAAAATT